MTQKTRVLIVDDSASMRRLIRMSLDADPMIEIVAEAATARQARDAVNTHAPDVMTLDVEMPEMDGLEFLRRLMRARPMPVVMLSSLTKAGSDAAVRALSLGAVECIAKPRFGAAGELFGNLAATLHMAAQARIRPGSGRVPARSAPVPASGAAWNGKIAMIGASTGGVEALETILSQFPEDCPPTLITQHMPAQFLVNFANRLNNACAPTIRLAREGDSLNVGEVLIAPGGQTHLGLSGTVPPTVALRETPKRSGHRPSVDEMFTSAMGIAPKVVAVILTGMGYDGAQGMLDLRQAGARSIAQDRDSSVVYGMPRMACEKGGVEISLPLPQIAETVLDLCSRSEKTCT